MDPGTPLTSRAFTTRVQVAQVAISLDGRERVCDTIGGERLERTVNSEAIDRKADHTVLAVEGGFGESLGFSHHQRLHEAVDSRTPAGVHCRDGRS
jgi:putative transposase